MPLLIPRLPESAHWYSRDGFPCHSVPYADKKRAGETRPTTLKDARPKGLLPSVTSILKLIRNAALDNWKAEQYILAALTLPRIDGEDDDAFARRVAVDAMDQVSVAADFGSAIHNAIENYLADGTRTDLAELVPYCGPCYEWIDENVEEVIGCEFVVSHRLGFAGRVDNKVVLRSGRIAYNELASTNPGFNGITVLDVKTRKHVAGKVASYQGDSFQLSAYLQADQDAPAGGLRPTATANLLVPSNEAMTPVLKSWSTEDMAWSWEAFQAILNCWKILSKYDPSF